MGYKENYESWLNNPYFDEDTRNELKSIEGNEKEIEDRFYMIWNLVQPDFVV
mgnify:CR=1 FL=1